jgi:hypothetical protein
VKALPLKTSWLTHPILICPAQLATVQKMSTPLASAFTLLIFMAKAACAQGQTSSPQGTPMTDDGASGDEKGNGGKYLLLPPASKQAVPPGYFPIQFQTINCYHQFRSSRYIQFLGPLFWVPSV